MQTTSARSSVFITGRLLHEDSFFEFTVEVSTNDIDLMNFPILGSSEGEKCLIRFEAHDRGVSGKEILSRDLREALCDESSLVFDNFAFGVSFDGKNPSAANSFSIRRDVFERVSAEIEELLDFGVHSLFPLGPVRARHNFFQRSWIV